MFRATPTVETPSGRETRRRFLDNPRVLTLAALLLIGVLGGLFWLSRRSVEFEPQVVTDVLLYPLLAVCVALLLALGFVLARNLIKLWVEGRRAEPFARFRAKLVGALLAMTIVPAVLVLITGSSILSDSAARWFSAPVDQVLTDAKNLARRFYQEQQESMARHAHRLARVLPPQAVAGADEAAVMPALTDELSTMHDARLEVYRRVSAAAPAAGVALVSAIESPTLALDNVRASADRLAQLAISSGEEQLGEDLVASGGTLLRAAVPIVSGDGVPVGAVVVSRHMPAEIDRDARRMAREWEAYRALELNREPILFSYLTILLTAALLILIAATWLGLYLAKRITRPVQQLAEGARAIGAGHLDVRLTPETSDEMGSLVEAFNMMAAELETNRGKLEGRRRYIETILERVATGVISLDASGRIQTINGAAERLLGIGRGQIGQPLNDVVARPDLEVLRPIAGLVETGSDRGLVQEISLTREGREINLAAAATVLTRADGAREGAVLVLDDVTPLIRAQRVAAWRDVARRLAHEIKNPLTPIQLSAERMRRHFAGGAPQTQALVIECTDAIITEVEALKGLVDEFAQFARMRGPRMVPADLNQLIEDTLTLYEGVLQQGHVRLERQLASSLPAVRIDGEQIRQVIINLADNALEALGGATAPLRPSGDRPLIIVMTIHDARNSLVRLLVSDNGPGVPASERDKLFMPYYSTKGRGSGLGLAIVRRILVEHGGGVEVTEAQPTGTTFTVELPVA